MTFHEVKSELERIEHLIDCRTYTRESKDKMRAALRHSAEALDLLEQIAYAFDMLTIAEVKKFGGIPSYACAVEMNDLRQLLAGVRPLLAPTREGRS